MKWVHISDIHFNFKNYNTDVLREKLIQFLEEENDMDRNAIIDQIRGNKLSIDTPSANKLVELGHEKFKNIYMEITVKNILLLKYLKSKKMERSIEFLVLIHVFYQRINKMMEILVYKQINCLN